ncbi:MAG: DNA mismatch repair protein MutS [Clostridiales Family XIII bacterium]|jgi:DNA mismatch repair protein MutS|nr:DNA mismatch repair protein MutS [Clostridiales Family XIII bacterium]
MSKLTPMMEQYMEIKERNKDAILFFRLGDFYEMFYDDAITAAPILEIALTKKNCGIDGERAPMCGVPFHAADTYIMKLVEAGYRVAVCEQTADPKQTKGLVNREVVRIVTPGTLTGESMLKSGENNYLVSVYRSGRAFGVAYSDISTGEIAFTFIGGDSARALLAAELERLKARELICLSTETETFAEVLGSFSDITLTELDPKTHDVSRGERTFARIFGVKSAKSLGGENEAAAAALYLLLEYIIDTQKHDVGHLILPRFYRPSDNMMLDKASIRNLELTQTLFENEARGSLLGVVDRTRTAMGGRLIKKWLLSPLLDTKEISARLDSVEILADDVILRNDLREHLKAVYDLERLAGRISFGSANARDLIALAGSLAAVTDVLATLADVPEGSLIAAFSESVPDLSDIIALIQAAIVDDPPFTVREGGMIRPGYSASLDEMKAGVSGGQEWIASLEAKERERTGIKNLKVGFNRVFGYYIDVTNSNRSLVPDDYIRKQTLVNSERYVTIELKAMESRVLGAEARINTLEHELFAGIRGKVANRTADLQKASEALAAIDVLCSYAEVSARYGYVKPLVDDGSVIRIERGRHPVIEQNLTDGRFVPNDVYIDRTGHSMLLITGPNMAGKSTYMRMTALIVLMAQAGCFVPADDAHIGCCDCLYTRIGASDNLAQGESTFFVEMSELAYILNTATDKSLVILDEIGRGTSTYDGLAIAWAVLEYLCDETRRIRTLFATHYHELTALEDKLHGMQNLNTVITEENGEVIFLHIIAEGSASRSYGIHVAKLAGVPQAVLDNANGKLALLESERKNIEEYQEPPGATGYAAAGSEGAAEVSAPATPGPAAPVQLSFFGAASEHPAVRKLKEINLMEITPSKAILLLEELKAAAEREGS